LFGALGARRLFRRVKGKLYPPADSLRLIASDKLLRPNSFVVIAAAVFAGPVTVNKKYIARRCKSLKERDIPHSNWLCNGSDLPKQLREFQCKSYSPERLLRASQRFSR
jgi:hypothetical protein